MEQRNMLQVLLLLLFISTACDSQMLSGPPILTTTSPAFSLPYSPLPTIPPTLTTGRHPLQPGKFSPCWGTIITHSLTWDILTTTFTNITVVPHITPFANGTNITSYETIAPQGPAPTHFLSTVMGNGSVCVAPTPCVEQLAQGCGAFRERQLFVRIDSTGSAGSTPFTNPSTYITATSIIATAYTAPPRIEPRVDPTTSERGFSARPKPSVPQSAPSNSSPRPIPPVISGIISKLVDPDPSEHTKPPVGDVNASHGPEPGSGNRRPGTNIPAGPAPTDLPNGFSILPSQSGVVLPDGQTLEPGAVTTINGIHVSLAPSGSFIAIDGSKTIPLAPAATHLPSGFSLLPSGSGIVLPNGETLKSGVATTVSGVQIFLSPSESFIAFDGSKTIALVPEPTPAVVLPNGETLKPGVLKTVEGVPVSLSPGETRIVIDGSTKNIGSLSPSNLRSYIWSGITAATASMSSDGENTSTKSGGEEATSSSLQNGKPTVSSQLPVVTGSAWSYAYGHARCFAIVVSFLHVCYQS